MSERHEATAPSPREERLRRLQAAYEDGTMLPDDRDLIDQVMKNHPLLTVGEQSRRGHQ